MEEEVSLPQYIADRVYEELGKISKWHHVPDPWGEVSYDAFTVYDVVLDVCREALRWV